MSADDESPVPREVAHRVFAAEYDDADYSWSAGDEERAPTYVITPSGAKVNRLFLVGVLTEVEQVNEDMLRARVVDPTGAFVVYAGQYQPDARAFFERVNPPAFVAVTGKARTFQPGDSDRIFTSVRPESVNEVDADTRDRWVVGTAVATLTRVRTMADTLKGDVRPAETAGQALAIAHYDTSPAYLASLRDLSLMAAKVVAGERDEVALSTPTPDVSGQADLDELAAIAAEPEVDHRSSEAIPTPDDDLASRRAAPNGSSPDEDTVSPSSSTGSDGVTEPSADTDEPAKGSDQTAAVGSREELGDFDLGDSHSGDGPDVGENGGDTAGDDDAAETNGETEVSGQPAEMYELDEGERRELERDFPTEFSTGSEVESSHEGPTEQDPSNTVSDAEPGGAAEESETGNGAEPDGETSDPEPHTGPDDSEGPPPAGDDITDSADADAGGDPAGDLSDVVMETMRDLDDGGGANRAELVDQICADTGAPPEAVGDAIQDVLMDGKCYEPDEHTLKPI